MVETVAGEAVAAEEEAAGKDFGQTRPMLMRVAIRCCRASRLPGGNKHRDAHIDAPKPPV